MSMSSVEIPDRAWVAMLDHVRRIAPEEACGLLGGEGAVVRLALPVENELHSPVRFRMAPAAQLEAMLKLDDLGLDLVAIYHSHPTGPSQPSATDLAEAAYPQAAYLVWSGVPAWGCRAFDLSADEPRPIPVRRLPADQGRAETR